MSMIKCRECGKEISDMAASCPNCGCPVKAKEPPKIQTGSIYKNCKHCGTKMLTSAEICMKCGTNQYEEKVEYVVNQEPEKIKDSALSLVSCVLSFVAFFIFNWLAAGGIICGLIDLGMKDEKHRHLGSYVGIILGIIVLFVYISTLRKMTGMFR